MTTRRVAEALGTGSASLYAHHAQQVWASHADIARASLATIPTGPERLRVVEGLLAILRAAGFSDQVAVWSVDGLQIYIDADVFEGRPGQGRCRAVSRSRLADLPKRPAVSRKAARVQLGPQQRHPGVLPARGTAATRIHACAVQVNPVGQDTTLAGEVPQTGIKSQLPR